MRMTKDQELSKFRMDLGPEEYRRQYETLYRFAQQSKHRYSNVEYTKTKEELLEIKEKYKNGVSKKVIYEMLGIKEN